MGNYSWGNDTSKSWNDGGFSYGEAESAYDAKKGYLSKKAEPAAQEVSKESMNNAYQLSQKLMSVALPADEKKLLERLSADDILVSTGQYDSVQDVLDAVKTPHKIVTKATEIDPKQVVLVNCPGHNIHHFHYKGKTGGEALAGFVEDGGFLVTTDWALDVVAKFFPGFIEHGGNNTTDDHVVIDLVAEKSPYTEGLGNGSLKPVWWLESSSYPIKLLRKKEIDVLLGSEEMRKKYGESPIAVKFPVGEGRVIHITSHFKLQTGKTTYEAQAKNTGQAFSTKFLGLSKKQIAEIDGLDSISFGAMESAYMSVRFLHNIFLEKIRKLDPVQSVKKLGMAGVSLKKLPHDPSQKSKKLI